MKNTNYNYAISDIHGCKRAFFDMLNKINFSNGDNLYILGDVIDRGEDSINILKYIMKENKTIKMILGNHEDMMLDAINNNNFERWFKNGGETTYSEFQKLSLTDKNNIIDFLESLPLYRIHNNFILVHAGISSIEIKENNPNDIDNALKYQSKKSLTWIRNQFFEVPTNLKDYKVVFGHTPTISIDISADNNIWFDKVFNDKIGIDCGAVYKKYNGKLACLRLEDLEEFYIKVK